MDFRILCSKKNNMLAAGILYEKYDYTYEERYHDGTTCSADFYIKDLDCWLELVYFPIGEIYAYESKQILNLPRCYYDDRHDAKKFGAKWNASQKTWYITPQDHSPEKIRKMWHWMNPKDFDVVSTTQKNMQVKGKNYEKSDFAKILLKFTGFDTKSHNFGKTISISKFLDFIISISISAISISISERLSLKIMMLTGSFFRFCSAIAEYSRIVFKGVRHCAE